MKLFSYALLDVFYLPKLMSEQQTWLEKLGLQEDFERQMKRIF